jgi:hypothetical protein
MRRGGYIYLDNGATVPPGYRVYRHKPYSCLGFLGDCFMTLITGGLWLVWIFVREMRRR